MQPLISIIIPFYNNKNYLGQCIESILQQDYIQWEAIFIDDASTDNSVAIIEQEIKKDNRIRIYRNKKNCGVSLSRKKGLAYAKGEYIMFLDGDDMLTENALSLLWKGMKGVDVCVGQHYILKGTNTIPSKSRTAPSTYGGTALCKLKQRMIYSSDGYSGMSMDGVIWKALFSRHLIYNNLMYMDSELWFSEDHVLFTAIMMDVSRLRIIDDYVYYYRKHGNNVTVVYKPFYFENSVRLYYDFRMLINNKHGSEEMEKTNIWFFLKNVEHSIKREVLYSGKDYSSCKYELNKMKHHMLVRQLLTNTNLAYIDHSGRKYLKLLRLGLFKIIYISLKWKALKKNVF